MRRKSIALLAIVAALSGCSVGPHYKVPNPAEVKLHQAQPSEITQEKCDGKWWGQFDDPLLNGLVDSSLRRAGERCRGSGAALVCTARGAMAACGGATKPGEPGGCAEMDGSAARCGRWGRAGRGQRGCARGADGSDNPRYQRGHFDISESHCRADGSASWRSCR